MVSRTSGVDATVKRLLRLEANGHFCILAADLWPFHNFIVDSMSVDYGNLKKASFVRINGWE